MFTWLFLDPKQVWSEQRFQLGTSSREVVKVIDYVGELIGDSDNGHTIALVNRKAC